MLQYIYNILATRLRTLSALKEVGWYMGQAGRNDAAKQYITPGAYIEFLPIATISEFAGKGVRIPELRFRIHTITTALHTDDKRTRATNPVDHLRLIDDIYHKLHGFRHKHPDDNYYVINTIQRTAITTDHAWNPLMLTVQEFTTLARWKHMPFQADEQPDIIITPQL